jgi:hypothetical protein
MRRFDLIFSIWIFIWYLLYEGSLITYNPKIFIIFALLHNIVIMYIIAYYKQYYILFLFIIIITIIKIIPLWRLRNTEIILKDFIFGCILFIIFNIWLLYNNTNILKININLVNNYKNGKINTPIMTFINKLLT